MLKNRYINNALSLTLILALILGCAIGGMPISVASAEGAGFAPSGYGERRYYDAYSCENADNLIANSSCDNDKFWEDSTGYITVTSEKSYEGNTSLKINGNGIWRKIIYGLKSDTYYYLSLYGLSDSENGITDINFGIADAEGRPFENPISEYETGSELRQGASKQEITILCPDGTWYNRTYRFYTGDNTEVNFFITGTKGIMYLDEIRIFEASKAISLNVQTDYDDLVIADYAETNYACNEEDNLFTNGMFDNGTEFWGEFNGINKFVEVATSKGNKLLHYKSSDMCYYYMPKAEVEADKYYTFSFWSMNLNGAGAEYGIVSLNNPRAFISGVRKVSSNYGEWQLVSIRFKAYIPTTVCLAVFDNGGEAVFDKVRLFESDKGYNVDLNEDMPIGGNTFSDSSLGSDGVDITLPDEQSALQMTFNSSDTYFDYSSIDFADYGANLVPDSTISQFENGTYKSYYDLISDSKGGAVLNANAWWDKAANRYQYFYNHVTEWGSMNVRGLALDNTGLSHTADGSGVLLIPADNTQKYLSLPKMKAKKYYLVTAWVKFADPKNTDIAFEFDYTDSVLTNYMYYKSNDWQRMVFLIYTGANEYAEPNIRIYNNGVGYADDFAVYELDSDYAVKCINAGKLVTPVHKMLGDVNGDTLINIKDLIRIKKALAKVTQDYIRINADIDSDGEITAADISELKKYLMGEVISFK